MLTETWLTNTSLPHNIVNYSFLSSLRLKSRGDGVGMFVNNSLRYVIMDRSCDHLPTNNIDYLLIKLQNTSITLCCMYCSPYTKLDHVIAQLEHV